MAAMNGAKTNRTRCRDDPMRRAGDRGGGSHARATRMGMVVAVTACPDRKEEPTATEQGGDMRRAIGITATALALLAGSSAVTVGPGDRGLMTIIQAEWIVTQTVAAECKECDIDIFNCAYVWQNPSQFTEDGQDNCDDQEWWYQDNYHRFPNPEVECNPEQQFNCRACGVTTDCHDEWDPGSCHEPCGAGGSFATLVDELHVALMESDAARRVAPAPLERPTTHS